MDARRDRRRMLVIIAFAGLAVLGPIIFWLAGNVVGIVYIVAAIALLGYVVVRGEPDRAVEVASAPDDAHRTLVVTHANADASALVEALEERGAAAEVHIVIPALTTRAERLTGEIDSAVEEANASLEHLIEQARSSGRNVDGSVGDVDPRAAVEDVLRTFAADEVVVLPPPQRALEFFRVSGPEETFRGVRLPVTVIES